MLWDKLERRLRARPCCPISVLDLKNAVLDEWAKIPTETHPNLVESLTRRVEAVIARKRRGGSMYLKYNKVLFSVIVLIILSI